MSVATLVPDYYERRIKAQVAMKVLGWGGQSRCSFGVHLAPSIICSILKGQYENVDHLAKIERWLATRPV